MFKEHPVFTVSCDEDARIWRYIDFTKLYSLLEKKALHFARCDLLSDKFEGSYPCAPGQMIPRPLPPEMYRDVFGMGYERYHELGSRGIECLRRSMYICSFHVNEYESAAMWKLFLKSDEGVAIQSTYKRLRDCFSIDDSYEEFIGEVKYIDYKSDPIEVNTDFSRYLHKRKSFEYERELRAILFDREQLIKSAEGLHDKLQKNEVPEIFPFADGIFVSVDIDKLIENVYIAPTAPDWFVDIVKAVSQRFGYSFEIVRSSLDDDPIY